MHGPGGMPPEPPDHGTGAFLVAYASKHGSTRQIAEHIATTLALAGQPARVHPADDNADLAGYDGFVIGSAIHFGYWLKDATALVARNRDLLRAHPVWLFSSGPLGPDTSDDSRPDPRTLDTPPDVTDIIAAIDPREHRVFFGALDPTGLTRSERAMRRRPVGRYLLPPGDYRNWTQIEAWARTIADQTHQSDPTRSAG